MMRMIALPIALALAAPLSAQGFTAPNDLSVAAMSGDRFEVIEASGIGATGLWCAAGAYARCRPRIMHSFTWFRHALKVRLPRVARPLPMR